MQMLQRQMRQQVDSKPAERLGRTNLTQRQFERIEPQLLLELVSRLRKTSPQIVGRTGALRDHRPKLIDHWVLDQRCDLLGGSSPKTGQSITIDNRALLPGRRFYRPVKINPLHGRVTYRSARDSNRWPLTQVVIDH